MVEGNAPNDPHKLAYIIFYWLGIGSLLPWNFFITVNSYWQDKFRNTTAVFPDGTNSTVDHNQSDLQTKWASYLSIASMIPNVTFLLLNAVFGHKFKTQPRLLTALVIVIVLFIFSTVMTKVDTDSWQLEFLGVTLFSVVIINVMVAIFQGGLSGLAGKFPPSYMGAVVQGQALGGIFAAGTNVVMLALGANAVSAAFYDFLIAVIFLATALAAFIVLTRTEFFKHYADEDNKNNSLEIVPETKSSEDAEQLIEENNSKVEVVVPQKLNILDIIKRIWIWIVAVFLCFLVTLSVFPAITVLVQSTGSGNAWSDTYFIPVGCFLLFNIGDYAGRMLASLIQWPKATHLGSLIILALSVSRLAFIPLFLFCNAAPTKRVLTSVYFDSDVSYLVLMVIFSVTNGYIGSICMIFGPKMFTNGQEQGQAASLLVSFLVMGLAVGAGLSGLIVQLL